MKFSVSRDAHPALSGQKSAFSANMGGTAGKYARPVDLFYGLIFLL